MGKFTDLKDKLENSQGLKPSNSVSSANESTNKTDIFKHVPQPGPVPILKDKKEISTLGGFASGAIAACGAVTFTNPIEVVKTRLQLQGELAISKSAPRIYKSSLQSFHLIFHHEGIRGLQRGLVLAYVYQVGLNGCRFGLYEPLRKLQHSIFFADEYEKGHDIQSMPVNVMAGAVSGMAGAVVGSPFYLIKTRMQSYSPVPATQVGEQTHYKSSWEAISRVYKNEGLKGLYRGVDTAIIRTGAGSAVQLPLYFAVKRTMDSYNFMKEGPLKYFLASTIAGAGVAVVMNPFDVLLTRMYNQKGDLYKSPIDCLVKTVKSEGVMALYKGFGAQILRSGPHTVLTLMFMEQAVEIITRLEHGQS